MEKIAWDDILSQYCCPTRAIEKKWSETVLCGIKQLRTNSRASHGTLIAAIRWSQMNAGVMMTRSCDGLGSWGNTSTRDKQQQSHEREFPNSSRDCKLYVVEKVVRQECSLLWLAYIDTERSAKYVRVSAWSMCIRVLTKAQFIMIVGDMSLTTNHSKPFNWNGHSRLRLSSISTETSCHVFETKLSRRANEYERS